MGVFGGVCEGIGGIGGIRGSIRIPPHNPLYLHRSPYTYKDPLNTSTDLHRPLLTPIYPNISPCISIFPLGEVYPRTGVICGTTNYKNNLKRPKIDKYRKNKKIYKKFLINFDILYRRPLKYNTGIIPYNTAYYTKYSV